MSGLAIGFLLTLFTTETPPETCALLQAGYRTFLHSDAQVYPSKIGAAPQSMGKMVRFDPAYRKYMALQPDEFEDLAARQAETAAANFVPTCVWAGQAQDPSGSIREATGFGVPIVSSDGKLALVEISFGNDFSAYGQVCILRRKDTAWSGHCLNAWSRR